MNREAVGALQEFAQVHQKHIRIFDDDKLEQLILSHRNDVGFSFCTFFPQINDVPSQEQAQFPITCVVEAFVCRQNTKYSMPALKKQRLRVNELFELRVSLVNQTLSDQNIILELDLERDGIYQYLDSEKRELHPRVQTVLGGGEATVVTFPFHITQIWCFQQPASSEKTCFIGDAFVPTAERYIWQTVSAGWQEVPVE